MANPNKLGWKWVGLAALFSRQLPNGSPNFFQTFSIYFFNYFIKNPQTTIALTFLTHIISGIGGVLHAGVTEKQTISYILHGTFYPMHGIENYLAVGFLFWVVP